MMELTTYTELEVAHRLMTSYAQKCRSLHGHRYEVEITVTAQKFNEDGMIVDFKKLKEVVKTVLDDKWDHGSCFNANDPFAEMVSASGSERVHIINANPTLEWMVEHWALELQEALDSECPGVAVSMLKASETARNTVTWRCNCLPWERSAPVDDAKKPICAERDKDAYRAACNRKREGALHHVASPDDSKEELLAEKGKGDWAKRSDTGEDNPDASLYLVEFRTARMPYSTTVRTALKGEALVNRCTEAAQEFAHSAMELVPGGAGAEVDVVVLNISKLPG